MTGDDVKTPLPAPFPAQARGGASRRALAGAPTDATSARERILDSATTVLRRHGYAGFSTRRVAEEAAIALGNLTYHFPSKTALVRALIERLARRYLDRFQEVLSTPGHGAEALVRWLLHEAIQDDAMWVFREFWAMALHDEVVRDAVDDLYDTLMDQVATTLEAAYPTADPGRIRDLVQFIALISEGSTVLYGTRRSRAVPHQRMVDMAVRLISTIAPELAGDR